MDGIFCIHHDAMPFLDPTLVVPWLKTPTPTWALRDPPCSQCVGLDLRPSTYSDQTVVFGSCTWPTIDSELLIAFGNWWPLSLWLLSWIGYIWLFDPEDLFLSQFVFDPTYLTISLSLFPAYDWSEFYGDIKGAIPSDMSDPLCNDADYSDHAEEKRTKCLCNRTLIDWVSVSPPTFDTSALVLLLLLCNTALKGWGDWVYPCLDHLILLVTISPTWLTWPSPNPHWSETALHCVTTSSVNPWRWVNLQSLTWGMTKPPPTLRLIVISLTYLLEHYHAMTKQDRSYSLVLFSSAWSLSSASLPSGSGMSEGIAPLMLS